MAYQIYTNVPSYNPSVSLFGDAAAQGAAVGKAIPTDTTAAIRGVQEGLDRGLNDLTKLENIETANLQQEAARARLPYEGDIARERAEGLELGNDLRRVQIEDVQANQQERQNLERSEITTKEAELDTRQAQLQQEQKFLSQFPNASPDQQIGMISSGEYSGMFAQNRKIYEQALDTIYMNPRTSTAQRKAIDNLRKRTGAVGYYEREANKRAVEFEEARTAVYNRPLTNEILSNTTDLLPEDLPEKIEFVPAGKFELTEDGRKFKINPKTGRRLVKEGYDIDEASDKYYAILKGTNQIVGSGDKKDLEAYTKYKASRKLQDGTFGRLAADRVTKQGQQEQQQTRQPPQQTQPATAPRPAAGESPTTAIMKEKLQLTDDKYAALKGPLDQLDKLSREYVRPDATLRRSTTSESLNKVRELTDTKDLIADYLIKQEWENSRAVQSRYTESDVETYNAQIDKEMRASLGVLTIFTAGKAAPLITKADELAAIAKVSTPEELYAAQRRKVLDRKVNKLFRDLIQYQKQAASSRARASQATQQQIQFIQATRHGIPTAG